MPCYDGREEVDKKVAIRLACEYCRKLEAEGKPIPSWAQAWWTDHKRYDSTQGR